MAKGRIVGQSPRHVWKSDGMIDTCERCGSMFSHRGMDAHGPFYCMPRPAWLAAHPEDDRKER
jgi:hypothetical protein